jgi:putative lipase involved disintegration of autophagic bodies
MVNIVHAGIQQGADSQTEKFVVHQPYTTTDTFSIKSKDGYVPLRQPKTTDTADTVSGLSFKSLMLPDHTDAETVLNFAKMSLDSYYEPDDKAWLPVPGWNVTSRFGWDSSLGIRGYLFQDTESVLKSYTGCAGGCL